MSDEPEWKNAAQMLAADNARLCEIALKADALALEVGRLLGTGTYSMAKIRRAFEAYTIVRNGT